MQKISSTSQSKESEKQRQFAPFARTIGRSRFVVLLAVIAVILVALSLFIIGTIMAVVSIWEAWAGLVKGDWRSTNLAVEFLEIVSVMLKAVVFYLIGVGLYSLFIAPLNLAVALGVETLNDLESKVISVVIVIASVTFLEHFILWNQPNEILRYGGTLAVIIIALVFFQFYNHRVKEDQKAHSPDTQTQAQHELFDKEREKHQVSTDLDAQAEDQRHKRQAPDRNN